jgi:hypothetical protein
MSVVTAVVMSGIFGVETLNGSLRSIFREVPC